MGQEVQQDHAISLPLMHALMQLFNTEWTKAPTHEHRYHVAALGAYSVICFCGSFRGLEGFLVVLHGLHEYGYAQISR